MRGNRGRLSGVIAALAALTLLLGSGPSQQAFADPVLAAPPVGVSVSQRPTMAILTWPAVTGAEGYAVDYDLSATFSAPFQVTSRVTFAVITDLSPETSYYVRVATWDPATNSTGAWGASQTFTTGAPEFAVPAPVLTLSSLTSTSITAEWAAPAPDLRYEVTLGRHPSVADQTKEVSDAAVTFSKLEKTTKYYVSVRAVDTAGAAVTSWSQPVGLETAESLPLRVGSYNIMCENCSKGRATWATRRGPLVANIKGQDLDVLGVQEASIGGIPGGGSQYMDLANRLGDLYKLTEYGRGVSPDVRIIYNSDRLKLVKHGIIALPRGASRRFLSWAVLEQKSTGKEFFFTSTHLEPNDGRKAWATRKRQANAIVAATGRLKGGRPVISVGDYASTKWEKWGNAPYNVMQAAGYKDPLGNAFRSHDSAPGAFVEKRINTTYSSYNMYKRSGRNYAGDLNGSNNDYIFTTQMRVSEYEVVVKVDGAGRLTGVIPSDHNLIRATVLLP